MSRVVYAHPAGTELSRFLSLLCIHRGRIHLAEEEAQWKYRDSPAVALAFSDAIQKRAIVEAGDTTTSGWASQLVGVGAPTELKQFVDGVSIFGRLRASMTQVPFRTPVSREDAPPTAAWVGEAMPKPISYATLGENVSLDFFKQTSIIVITDALVRFTTPGAWPWNTRPNSTRNSLPGKART